MSECERCQGNGEIVIDWDRYRRPQEGDVGDEAVAECPDCFGRGFEEHCCPICAEHFVIGDPCATDIELGTCHAACLDGSPVVDLETGKPIDGRPDIYSWLGDW